MKKTIKITALVLALVLCTLTLASCSAFGSIKSNFEKNGYALQNADNEPTGTVTLDDGSITYIIHTFQKEAEENEDSGILGNIVSGVTEALSTAVVWEFDSEGDLEKAIEKNEQIKSLLEKAQKSDYVNGNCILMTFNPEAVQIFKGEK